MPDIKLTESDFPAAEAGKFVVNDTDDLSGDYLLGRQVAQEYDSPTVQLYLNEQIKQEDVERQAAESEEREAAGIDVSLERNEREFAETMVDSLQSRRGEAFKSLPKEVEKEESEKIAAEFERGVEDPNFDPFMAGAAGFGGVGKIAFNQTKALIPSLTRAITAGVVNAVGDVPIGVGMDVLDIKAPGLALPFGIVAGLLQGATVENAIERGIVKAATKAGRSLSKVDIADMVQANKLRLANEFGQVGDWRDLITKYQDFSAKNPKASIDEIAEGTGMTKYQAENVSELSRLNKIPNKSKELKQHTKRIQEQIEAIEEANTYKFTAEDLELKPDQTKHLDKVAVRDTSNGKVYAYTVGQDEVFNHADIAIKHNLDFENVETGFTDKSGKFTKGYRVNDEMAAAVVEELNTEIAKAPLSAATDILKSQRGAIEIGGKQRIAKFHTESIGNGELYAVYNKENVYLGKAEVWDLGNNKYKIENVFIEPEFQKQGIATELIKRIKTDYKDSNLEFGTAVSKEGGMLAKKSGIPKPPDMQKAADEFTAKKPSEIDITKDYAGNIRLWGGADLEPKFMGQIETPEDINRVIAGTHETFASETEAARRGVRSWDETKEAAKQYNLEDLMGRKLGQAYAAEEIENARTLLVSSSDTLKAMSDKVRTGQANDLEKMEFMKAFNLNYAIQMQLSGAAAEAGRALNIFRKVAQSDALRVGQIKDFLATTADASINPEKLAQAISEMELPGQVNKLVKQARRASSWDMFVEAWINGLLSGPVTHAVNTTSNALVALYAVPERLFAAGISQTVGSGVIRKGEASAQAFGLIEGFKDGLKAGWKSLRSGESADITTKIEQQQYRAISAQNVRQLPLVSKISPNALEEGGVAARAVDILGEAIRVPGRFLTAEDDFFKSIGYRMELNAQAFRKAAGEGLEGDALALRIQEIKADPEKLAPEIHLAAIDAARYQTFTNELGPAGKGVQAAANNSPLKLIIPFIRTPANILKFAASRSPLAVAMPSVWQDIFPKVRTPDALARRELALARVSLGSMAMATIASFAASGHVTGGGPTDTGLRSHKYNQGWQPYSIKIGDSYYAYGRLEPLGMMMGLAADFVEIGGELSELEGEEIATTIVAAFSKNVMSKTWLRGLSEAVSALDDPDRYGPRYVRRFTGTVIPTGVAQVERVISPEMSEVRSMMDSIKSRIPGYSKDIPDRRNLWGEKILLSPGLGPDIMSPIFTSKKKSSPIDKELEELKAPVRMPSRTQSFEGVRIALTPQQYDDFVVTMNKSKIVGPDNRERNLKDTLNYLVTKNSDYKSLRGNDLKEQFIRDYIRQAQVQTRNEMAETDADIKFFIEESQRIEQAANF